MANRKKVSSVQQLEPTFDKQMDAYSEGEQNPEDPIFSGAYHLFMSNLLKKRDKSVMYELLKENKKNNKVLHDKLVADVHDIVDKQWTRTLRTELSKLSGLQSTLTTIAGDVNLIKLNLEQLEKRQTEDEKEIAMLKEIHELPIKFDERLKQVEKLIPTVNYLVESDKDTQTYRSPKWTGIRYAMLGIIIAFIVLVIDDRFPNLIHNILKFFGL